MDADTHVTLMRLMRLAGVETHPNPKLDTVMPAMRGDRSLRCDRRRDGVSRTSKRDEERVSLRVDFDSTIPLEYLPKDSPMLGKHFSVPPAEPLDEFRRAIDVGEQERDGSGRQQAHPHSIPGRARTSKSREDLASLLRHLLARFTSDEPLPVILKCGRRDNPLVTLSNEERVSPSGGKATRTAPRRRDEQTLIGLLVEGESYPKELYGPGVRRWPGSRAR